MSRITSLTHLVRGFYESHRDTWIPAWTEYLYEHHIFFVAEEAKKLSEEFHVDGEFAIVASLLHDIADAILPRNHSEHTIESEKIALDLLTKAWFTEQEIEIIVYDIIAKHSCREGIKPTTIQWQIMVSADAIGHLATDFYEFAIPQMIQRGQSREDIQAWWFPKIERDFYMKICFDTVRERYKSDYDRCKNLFISL